MNSRAKGARAEREVAHLFRKIGFEAERGQQHDGMSGHADVVGTPFVWVEVKRRENLNLDEAMQQAERDNGAYLQRTGEALLPVVIHRKNNAPWRVTMRIGDLVEMYAGPVPYSTDAPVDVLVTMLWDGWARIYTNYVEWRRQ